MQLSLFLFLFYNTYIDLHQSVGVTVVAVFTLVWQSKKERCSVLFLSQSVM